VGGCALLVAVVGLPQAAPPPTASAPAAVWQGLTRADSGGTLRAQLDLAQALLSQHAAAAAAARLRGVVRAHAESRDAWRLLAQALAEDGAYTEAAAAVRSALRRWPSDRNLRYQQATLALMLGREPEARRELEQLTVAWPRFGAAQYSLAVDENDRGDFIAALRHLAAAEHAAGTSPQTAFLRGLLCERLHRFSAAEAALRTALKGEASNIAAHVALARVLAKEGQQAASASEQLLAADLSAAQQDREKRRAQVAAWTQRGEQAALENRFSAALATYEAALGLDAGDVTAHLGKGKVLYSAGEYPAARREFQAAVVAAPFNPEAHYLLGLVAERLQETATSRTEYGVALALHPGDSEAALALVRLLRASGETEAARRVLATARQANPEDPDLRSALRP